MRLLERNFLRAARIARAPHTAPNEAGALPADVRAGMRPSELRLLRRPGVHHLACQNVFLTSCARKLAALQRLPALAAILRIFGRGRRGKAIFAPKYGTSRAQIAPRPPHAAGLRRKRALPFSRSYLGLLTALPSIARANGSALPLGAVRLTAMRLWCIMLTH